ncbi:MAG: beta strand repeat-containing protein [Cytophagales bacterium]
MKKVFTILLIAFAFVVNVSGQTTDLFFSEYLEGSSNNKALEIFNGTGVDIDFDVQRYVVRTYSNGATTAANNLTLTGIIKNNSTYVISNSSAITSILGLASVTSGVTNYNGDDAVALFNGETLIDAIGQIGFDPGSNWIANGVATNELTLIRKATVCTGDANSTDAFDPSVEWFALPQNDASSLGTHTISGCVAPSLSSANTITGFTVAGVAANINGLDITATVPFGTTLNGIMPMGDISPLATVNPSFATTQDFTSLVSYTVTAEDLSTQVYNVSVTSTPASSAKLITIFNLPGQSGSTISGNNVFVSFPSGATINSLSPSAAVSNDATVSPAFGASQDFGNMVVYTVTAQDMSTNVYTVVSTIATILSDANDITDFTVAGVAAMISGTTISATVPFGTNLTNIAPLGSISAASTVNPAFTVPQDFRSMVSYTVTAQDLSIEIYTVTVTALPGSSANALSAFTLQGGFVGSIVGTNIAIAVPFGTSLANLTAAGTISANATVAPAFATALNYGSARVLTVTAQNMTSVAFYSVSVTVMPSVPGFAGVTETFTVDPVSLGWSIYTPKSLKNWFFDATNGRMEGNGFGSTGASSMESWLITPKLTFAGASQAVAYGGSFSFADAGTAKPAQVLYSTNYIGTGPVSVAGWNVIADDYQGVVTVAGFKNFTSTGTGYIAFRYISSSPASGGSVRWRLDNVSITGASIFTPTVVGFTYNVEANIPSGVTLTGIQPISYLRNSVSATTGLSTLSGALVVTIAGRVTGPNQRGTSDGYQFRIIDTNGDAVVFRATTSVSGLTLTDGDLLTVAGTVTHFNGLLQLTSTSYIKGANVAQRQMPTVVTSLSENTESKIITMVASSVSRTSWNDAPTGGFDFLMTVAGSPVLARIQTYHTGVYGKTYTELFGSEFNVTNITITGFGGQFDSSDPRISGYQLEPYLASDIIAVAPVAPSTLAGFTSFFFPANALLGLLEDVVATINGSNIDFVVSSNVTVNGLNLFYTLNTGAKASISNGSTPSFLFSIAGNNFYTDIVVTAQAGNIATYRVNVKVATPTSTLAETELSDLLIYPNPSNGTFNIAADNATAIEIYNLIGVKVFATSISGKVSNVVFTESKGIYFLKVISKSGASVVKRIVVE